jgi:hypothetical protein
MNYQAFTNDSLTMMYEGVRGALNCIAPGSLSATLALIVIGAAFALTAERRKLALVRSDK